MTGCLTCGEDQRDINNQYNQTKQDAQKIANETKKSFAVFPSGTSYTFSEIINGIMPNNTRKVIKPM